MKKHVWLSMSALIGAMLLLCGCPSVESARYMVTSFAEITIDKGASVRVMADRENVAVAEALRAALDASKQFSMTEGKADYWVVLRGAGAYREPCQALVTKVVEKDGETAGEEVLVQEPVNVASAARELAIAIYDAKNLAPIHYMTVAIHDGDNSEEAARGVEAYSAQFATEVVERVKDALLTREKEVKISIPKVANAGLRDAFKDKDYVRFLELYKTTMGKLDIAAYTESIRKETCEDENVDEKLANYHLYLLVKEAMQKDAKSLKAIKAEQLMLLQVSKEEGLAIAVPMALGRIENQLKYVD